MKILLVNTNTTDAVTERITACAKHHAAAGTEIVGTSAEFGPEIISTRTETAISTHALIDLCAKHAGSIDAVIVGMSLDSGVWAAREFLDVPVIGMSEAALHMASLHGNRIGLFVFGGLTQPYQEMVEAYGFQHKVATVEALGITPKQHLADPTQVEDRIVDRITILAEAGMIDAAILVGAVAVGLPEKLAGRLPVPTFEGISCAVLLAQSLVRIGAQQPTCGSFARPRNRASTRLSPELTRALQQDR